MYLKRLRKAIPERRNGSRDLAFPCIHVLRRVACFSGVLLTGALVAACGAEQRNDSPNTGDARDPDTFLVMSYNLDRYAYQDRTGDGQMTDMKPDASREAVLRMIAEADPDILALQEMGGDDVFAAFQDALAKRGMTYPFAELVQQNDSDLHIGLLCRYPVVSAVHHLQDTYSMGPEERAVGRGFLEADISINPDYQFRLMVAHLKSKQYHPLGQTEMRRNEARLLNNHIRRSLEQSHRMNLLVVGDMSDTASSAALRTITGDDNEYLVDLRLADSYGEIWTYFDPENETYVRHDYMLASPAMVPEYIQQSSRVIRDKAALRASAHRPLVAVFHAKDMAATPDALLPAYEDVTY